MPNHDSSRRVLCLFSGGYDSLFLMHLAQQQTTLTGAVYVMYAHRAWMQEQIVVNRFCAQHNVPVSVVSADLIGVNAMNAPSGQPGPRIVPGRNLAFLALAVNRAVVLGANEVWYGATAEDARNYPDCRSGFVEGCNMAGKAYGVRVAAPLVRYRREDLIRMETENGWDLSGAWSCYAPVKDGSPCGSCDSCKQPRSLPLEGE